MYSPRRTLLDSMLVEAARAAGAEVREGFAVSSLLFGRTGRVTGIRGSSRERGAVTEDIEATLVVGADGKHSIVAKAVDAKEYHVRPAVGAACYTYYSGLPVEGGEVYTRPDRVAGLWPTDDGLTLVFLFVPCPAFHSLTPGW